MSLYKTKEEFKMQKLTYTRFDRDMELALFRLQQFHQIKATDGLEVACNVVEPEDAEATFLHDIPIEHLPIYESLNVLEKYAYEERWSADTGIHIGNMQMFIQSVAHPDLVKGWLDEAAFDQSVHMEDGGNTHFNAFGNHYKGILEDITSRSQARYNLDHGVHLTLSQIAYLAELNERTVMNAVQYKGSSCLKTDGKDKNGRLLVDSTTALEWLSSKETFRATQGIKEVAPQVEIENDRDATEWIFVPESRDGTQFLPNLRTRNGYMIGRKGSERHETDFFQALKALVQMDIPSWRRKNVAGNAGIVSGVHWVRVSATEVEKMLTS